MTLVPTSNDKAYPGNLPTASRDRKIPAFFQWLSYNTKFAPQMNRMTVT
jgi:hypothetical protein